MTGDDEPMIDVDVDGVLFDEDGLTVQSIVYQGQEGIHIETDIGNLVLASDVADRMATAIVDVHGRIQDLETERDRLLAMIGAIHYRDMGKKWPVAGDRGIMTASPAFVLSINCPCGLHTRFLRGGVPDQKCPECQRELQVLKVPGHPTDGEKALGGWLDEIGGNLFKLGWDDESITRFFEVEKNWRGEIGLEEMST